LSKVAVEVAPTPQVGKALELLAKDPLQLSFTLLSGFHSIRLYLGTCPHPLCL